MGKRIAGGKWRGDDNVTLTLIDQLTASNTR